MCVCVCVFTQLSDTSKLSVAFFESFSAFVQILHNPVPKRAKCSSACGTHIPVTDIELDL